jgi:hypothetical protein
VVEIDQHQHASLGGDASRRDEADGQDLDAFAATLREQVDHVPEKFDITL